MKKSVLAIFYTVIISWLIYRIVQTFIHQNQVDTMLEWGKTILKILVVIGFSSNLIGLFKKKETVLSEK